MPFTLTKAHNILEHLFGAKTLTAPEYVYIGLCSNDPEADEGSITELSGNGYSRVLIARGGQAYPDIMSDGYDRSIWNKVQINWTKATGDWVDANGFFLASSSTVGDTSSIFFYGKLETAVSCKAGEVALFDPNSLRISFPKADVPIT